MLTESSVGKRRFLFLELGHPPLDSQDEVEGVETDTELVACVESLAVFEATLSSKLDKRSTIEESVLCSLVSSDVNELCISARSEWTSTELLEGIHSPGCQFLSGESFTEVTQP